MYTLRPLVFRSFFPPLHIEGQHGLRLIQSSQWYFRRFFKNVLIFPTDCRRWCGSGNIHLTCWRSMSVYLLKISNSSSRLQNWQSARGSVDVVNSNSSGIFDKCSGYKAQLESDVCPQCTLYVLLCIFIQWYSTYNIDPMVMTVREDMKQRNCSMEILFFEDIQFLTRSGMKNWMDLTRLQLYTTEV